MPEYYTKQQYIVHFGAKSWPNELKERKSLARSVPLKSKTAVNFWLVLSDDILQTLSFIENERGFLSGTRPPPSFIKKITQAALYHEAYYSSRIEGAVTSLHEALLSLKSQKKRFTDESRQMIVNNKLAIEFMKEQQHQPITDAMICRLQLLLLANTHKSRPVTMGKYRTGPVYVVNSIGQTIYEAPPAKDVPAMMADFIAWLNQKSNLHALLKAAIAHLYFVHIHPFDDGNGRCARALSNLVLANHGYDFINLLAPSSYFDQNRPAYYKAIRNVENHDHDLTYFIVHYLAAITSQLQALKGELNKESCVKSIKDVVSAKQYIELNHRQIRGIQYLLNTPGYLSTKKYCKLNKCSDETARQDFLALLKLKLISQHGKGRACRYGLHDSP